VEVPTAQLGRNVSCRRCGWRFTARPPDIEAALRRQQARLERTGQHTDHPHASPALPRLPFAVLVDNVRSLWNVGALFRTADACGVERLVLAGISGQPPRPEIAKTALGAEAAVPWRYRADPGEALEELVREGYAPVALEASSHAVSLEQANWPPRLCLVVGNEVAGVTPAVLSACSIHVSIPMRGVKSSLNVAVAFGIAAHHAAAALARRQEQELP
jgi:tRNA G18 (ribose-2'-O)-methylase SpoU